jgi:hypothetical protein
MHTCPYPAAHVASDVVVSALARSQARITTCNHIHVFYDFVTGSSIRSRSHRVFMLPHHVHVSLSCRTHCFRHCRFSSRSLASWHNHLINSLLYAACETLPHQLHTLQLDWLNAYKIMQLLLAYCAKPNVVKAAYNKTKHTAQKNGTALSLLHSQESKLFNTYCRQLNLQHPGDLTMAPIAYYIAQIDADGVVV